ncbi:hypothetical protein NJT12_03290 [Flavobacterium sp. AC]|uniref:Uncharacterized protein n=1 Tax=Flavobacterium azizsancarii TaxID=2961580 RepID=A0ABT4W932_9FLAO|nr:hypothetical protein [Flavobacterium azizsancarii]MDA6068635.1 hypothetical protein [Flavobacterium azizsancarii]
MNQTISIISTLITVIGGTGYFTFLFARSKNKQEIERLKVEILQAKNTAETTSIDNDIKLSSHYKQILDDLKTRYEDRYKEFENILCRKISMLEEELKLKDRKIKLQQAEISELKKENRILKKNAINRST